MRQGLSTATRVADIFETRGEFRAIEAGLSMLRNGDLILVQADQVEPSLAFIEQYIATNARTEASGDAAPCGCAAGVTASHAAGAVANGQFAGPGPMNGAAAPAGGIKAGDAITGKIGV